MKTFLWLTLLFSTLVLAGCWDTSEPERMLYVNGLGVDFKDNQFEVYVQIIDFANTAKSEQPPTNKPQAEIGHAKGATIDDAIIQLYHTIDQKVFWGHFSYIVVSEDVLKHNKLNPIIDSFIRYRETRYQIWLYTTQGLVQDVLLARPVINKALTLSKLGDPINSYEQESFVYPINVRQFIIGLDEPGHEAAIPLINVKENWQSSEESIGAPILSGIGVVSRDSFIGYISGASARGLQWMTKETKRGRLSFATGVEDEASVVIDKVKPTITPSTKDGVKFNVEVDVEATLSTKIGHASIKEIRKGAEEEISKQIMETYMDAVDKGIDVYRFSEHLYRKELKTWEKYQQDGRIELTEDSLGKLNVRVRQLNSDRKSFQETIK